MKGTVRRSICLYNNNPGHDKIYLIDLIHIQANQEHYVVLSRYGPRDSMNLSEYNKVFPPGSDAHTYFEELIEKKKKRGYHTEKEFYRKLKSFVFTEDGHNIDAIVKVEHPIQEQTVPPNIMPVRQIASFSSALSAAQALIGDDKKARKQERLE